MLDLIQKEMVLSSSPSLLVFLIRKKAWAILKVRLIFYFLFWTHHLSATTSKPNACYYCRKSSDALLDFGSFKSCRPCMKRSTEMSDKARACLIIPTNGEHGSSEDNNVEEEEAEDEDGEAEDEDVQDLEANGEESSDDVSDGEVVNEDNDGEGSYMEVDDGGPNESSNHPQSALKSVLEIVAKRPESFEAISVFQEPIKYSTFQPFDTVQPFDAGRTKYYVSTLVRYHLFHYSE